MTTPAAQAVREKVLRTADRLFYSRGLHAVSMDDIRDTAGVSLKALYTAFPSKADLVAAYLERRDSRWREATERYITERSDDPREQLLLAFDALSEFVHRPDTRGCAMQQAFSELSGTFPQMAGVVRDHKAYVRRLLILTARRAGVRRPAELGSQLMVLLEGALITYGISGDPAVARHAKSAAVVLIDAERGTMRRKILKTSPATAANAAGVDR